MGVTTQAPTGIVGWVSQYGQVVYFFAQIGFWLLLVAVLAWAAWELHRWVAFLVGGRVVKVPVEDDEAGDLEVDDFVD